MIFSFPRSFNIIILSADSNTDEKTMALIVPVMVTPDYVVILNVIVIVSCTSISLYIILFCQTVSILNMLLSKKFYLLWDLYNPEVSLDSAKVC